jgi:hypothetical protein
MVIFRKEAILKPSQLISRANIDDAYDEIHGDMEFAYKRAKVLADMLGIPVHEHPEVTGTILGLVRGSVERLMNQVVQLQHDLEKCRETSTDEEANRWCDRLKWLHTEYCADASGCDSGDPLDCVEVEIRQAINSVQRRTAHECLERLHDAIWDKEGTLATGREAIKAQFGIVE